MRKNIITTLATIIFAVVVLTGCSTSYADQQPNATTVESIAIDSTTEITTESPANIEAGTTVNNSEFPTPVFEITDDVINAQIISWYRDELKNRRLTLRLDEINYLKSVHPEYSWNNQLSDMSNKYLDRSDLIIHINPIPVTYNGENGWLFSYYSANTGFTNGTTVIYAPDSDISEFKFIGYLHTDFETISDDQCFSSPICTVKLEDKTIRKYEFGKVTKSLDISNYKYCDYNKDEGLILITESHELIGVDIDNLEAKTLATGIMSVLSTEFYGKNDNFPAILVITDEGLTKAYYPVSDIPGLRDPKKQGY